LEPEEQARQKIDELLEAAGWKIQNKSELNIGESLGVAVREFQLGKDAADYLLFVDRKPVGVVEAKKVGTTLSGVAEQSEKYLELIKEILPNVERDPPFHYETTGIETFFRDKREPNSRSRRVFAFHKPETLLEWYKQEDTLRSRLQRMPKLQKGNLWDCQYVAVGKLEESFAESRPRALIQMATGSGKTFTAVSFIYRLIKHTGAKRVLFLVDRNNLGRQTKREFEQYVTPDDGRKFTELYNVHHLSSNTLDWTSKVWITTIQRLYSMLLNQEEFEEENEEQSLFDINPQDQKPVEVNYNPKIPIESFDFIVTDECHRSIYHLWRQVLEYYDSFIIGLTATPSKQTLGFFNQNLVTEYSHERAVVDGVNVQYYVYRIKTSITETGSAVEAGEYIDKRDRTTRKLRWEKLEDGLDYAPNQLDRDVVAKDQIRTVIRTFKQKLFTEIFPGRKEVPKTLIFAKNDSHAEDIVEIVREEFGRGNDFCKKITYRTTGEKPEDLIASFRNSYNPRITVTVDMIATGTDIRPLECLIFMRNVNSAVYFEQMKGRGTRTISRTDLNAVTPDALSKTHFVVVDAVGVCEKDKTETRPLERSRSVPFDKLLEQVAIGRRDIDTISSLAARLARFDKELINDNNRKEIELVSGGKSLRQLANLLIDSLDPDKQIEKAKEIFKTQNPTDKEISEASKKLIDAACKPFDQPKLRNTIIDIKAKNEQIIDNISKDKTILAEFDKNAKERSLEIINNFKKFIEENKDELTALQIVYSMPYSKRHITYEEIKQLAEVLGRPPYQLSPDILWKAYEQLEKSRVRKAAPQKLLTDIISLTKFALGKSDVLEPFSESVNQKFEKWITEQEKNGKKFTSEQKEWLVMIKNHIATSLTIGIDDFEYTPFNKKGGAIKLQNLFGDNSKQILNELNEVLVVA